MTASEALKILELFDCNPDAVEIKKAYRRMILCWHPDTYTGPLTHDEITAKAQSINEAFETLSKIGQRKGTRTQPKSRPSPPSKTGPSKSPPQSDYWRVYSGKTDMRVPYAPNPRHRSLRRRCRDSEVTHGFPVRHLREFFFFFHYPCLGSIRPRNKTVIPQVHWRHFVQVF